MDSARIAELLAPFLGAPVGRPKNSRLSNACHPEPANVCEEPAVLSQEKLQSISTYIDLLLRWNPRVNLTAIRNPEEIVTRHFGESLFAARYLFPCNARAGTGALGCPAEPSSAAQHVADLGSGAGFPGVPIKLWAPSISLTLIESNQKKAAFLREVVRSLTLTDINITTARAESLTGVAFDLVILRAVERFTTILPTAAALVAPGGKLALLIGSAQVDQARALLSHFSWSAPQPVPCARARALVVAQRSV